MATSSLKSAMSIFSSAQKSMNDYETLKSSSRRDDFLTPKRKPFYENMQSNNLMNIMDDNLFVKHMENLVAEGKAFKISEDNIPFICHYNSERLNRKVKINRLKHDFDIKMLDAPNNVIDGFQYSAEEIQTSAKRVCNETKNLITDEIMKDILDFCKKEDITHIYSIIEKRYAVIFDRLNMSISQTCEISDFSKFGLDYRNVKQLDIESDNDSKYLTAPYDTEESDMDSLFSDNHYQQLINKEVPLFGYVFAESTYSVRGFSQKPKNVIDEYIMCRHDFDYFYKKYIKKS